MSSILSQRFIVFFLVILMCARFSVTAAESSERVQLVRTPNGGIQPQAVVDAKGVLHLIYFKGDAKAGDVFYVRKARGQAEFSKPVQVNSIPDTAIAVGTIRGAHLAVGRNGRAHVAWNGNKSVPDSKHKGAPMWYARLNDAGTGFEPQRDLMNYSGGLDGGGSLAADADGNVYVMWHGFAAESVRGEEDRAVFLARSSDDGKTFAREERANPRDTGACGCCGMRAFADSQGNVFALYRAAGEKVNRDETLLVSRDHGRTFDVLNEHRWKAATCPMSSAALIESKTGTIAAWETAEQVYFMAANPKTLEASRPIAPPGVGKRKHPSAAVNENSELLLAWTEGTGWQKGGSIAWQFFDAKGNPASEKGRAPGVPVWGLVAAVANPNRTFVIYY
jgi:hypothetical protein